MIIGITGGIGSGKSFIAHGLAEHGFALYDCDKEAKRLMEENNELKKHIIALLGENAYQDGHYQTNVVADKVFNNPTLLQALNAIVHPAVKADILRFAATCNLQSATIVESAILYESGVNDICDKVIAVVADEDIRLNRAIARDHSNIAHVRARMHAQMSDKERAQRADIVVTNNGDLTSEQICQYIQQHL